MALISGGTVQVVWNGGGGGGSGGEGGWGCGTRWAGTYPSSGQLHSFLLKRVGEVRELHPDTPAPPIPPLKRVKQTIVKAFLR